MSHPRTSKRVVARSVEIIDRPDSSSLKEYHGLLTGSFGGGEVEPLRRLQKELASNTDTKARAHYLCVLLRDPQALDRIASGAYASVQDGILAIRFAVTAQDYQGAGLGSEVIRVLVAEASRWSARRGQALRAYFGECVESAEGFFNRVLGIRRLYALAHDGYTLREIHYELPHLGDWAADGMPLDPAAAPVPTHLQVAVAGHTGRLPFTVLEKVLTTIWHEWYVRPEGEFDSRCSWEDHKRRVLEGPLRSRILGPLRQSPKLVLLSRAEREQRRWEGARVEDMAIEKEHVNDLVDPRDLARHPE